MQYTLFERVFKKSESVIARNIAGEVILVPLRKNVGELDNIYTLNETGTFIWNMINGQYKLNDILEMVLSEYEISEVGASQDLIDIIDRLVGIGALEQV